MGFRFEAESVGLQSFERGLVRLSKGLGYIVLQLFKVYPKPLTPNQTR